MRKNVWLLLLSLILTCTLPTFAEVVYDGDYQDSAINDHLYNVFNDKDQYFEKVYLEDTPINRIYAVRLLLNSPEYFTQGITYLNQIIRRGGFTPSAKRNLEDAASIIREYDLVSVKKWFNIITGQSKIVEKRAFMVAQYFLNEAIMNSRVRLNISSVNEKVFLDTLFRSYFFPLMGKNIKIKYPKKEEFAFTKWQIVESILVDTLMLNSSDVEKIKIIRGESDFFKRFKNYILEELGTAIDEGNYEAVVEKGLIDLGIKTETAVADPANKGLVTDMIGAGVMTGIPLTPEQKKQLYKLIYSLYKDYVTADNIPVETYNDTIRLSLLMQLIADPGTVAVDPQLRTFAEKIKVEIILGTEENASFDELYNALKGLSTKEKLDSCASINESNEAEFDLECLYKRSQDGVGMNRKSINKIIIGMQEQQNSSDGSIAKPIVRLITSVGGEDLQRLRFFITIAKLHLAKNAGQPIFASIPSILWNVMIKLLDSSSIKPIKHLALTAKSFENIVIKGAVGHLTKGFDKADKLRRVTHELADRFTLPTRTAYYEKISNPIRKKLNLKPKYPSSAYRSRLDNIFHKIVYLAAFAEAASFVSDMYILDNINEKRDSIAKHGGNLIALKLYLINFYGTCLASWDMLAASAKWVGLENTPYSNDILAGAITYMLAWGNGTSNPTNLKLNEIEKAYQIPLSPMTLEMVEQNMSDDIDLDNIFMEATNQTVNGIGRMIAALYFSHRAVNENTVDTFFTSSFGKKVGVYENNFKEYMISYGKTLKAATKKYPQISDLEEISE